MCSIPGQNIGWPSTGSCRPFVDVHVYSLEAGLPLPLSPYDMPHPPPQDPRQFWTLFPHTPDNSFLGFVVEPVAMAADVKKNQAVIYGKEGTEV